MAVVGQLLVLVGVNNAGLTAGLASSQAQLKGFSGAAGASMALVRTAVVGAGIGAAVGLTLGVKAAADFEDAFAGVRKTVDEADLAAAGLTFETLAQQFRDMATEIPVAATELAAIGETAGALGIAAQDIEEFTRIVALLGVTTDLSTDVAAEALGKIGTILGFAGQDYQDFADILVNLGNQGASVESEIIEVTKRFAAQGKQAGLTTAEITALASVSTSLGAQPEAAGSSLSRIFSNMSTDLALANKKGIAFADVTAGVFDELAALDAAGGGKHTVGAFDVKGADELIRLQQAIERGDALPVFLKFLQELGKLGPLDAAKALKGVGISNVLSRNAIINMAQNIGEVTRQLDVATESTGALGVEAAKRFDTFNSKLTLLGNNFTELFITIGTPLLPIAAGFVASVTGAIRSVSEWVAAGADLGNTFGPIIQTIITRLGELWTIAQGVGVVIMDFATRVWEGGLNRVIGTAADVLGSIVDTIGGLATAILENQDAMNILKKVGDGIGTGFGIASDAVSSLLGFLGRLGDAIRTNEDLMRTLAGIGDAISAAFVAAGPAIQVVIDAITEAARLAGVAADEILRLAGGKPAGVTDMRNPDRNPGVPVARGADPLGTIGDVIGGAGDWIFRGGRPEGAPVQINIDIPVVLDGEKVGSVTDRRLYNNASQYSSGFGGELR